ncbi:hypothetical protein R6242_19775 [Iodobacter sp. CM08]|uniref:hypothetical protein n=1 Tax=Iodobacter sp. CM08 TaxID=3085902 RepID=UPI002980E012|nr:hypothetical protein [Iodobacter sp. CM08]MDW5418812.1 hypothetical protein [Iodobacter sp. CM08]
MMRAIKYMILLTTMVLGAANATTNMNCLEHLGGGMSDISCYNDLTKEVNNKNELIIKDIINTIPKKSNILLKIKKNIANNKSNVVDYCNIKKMAANNWELEGKDGMSEHKYMDVIYYECIYTQAKILTSNLQSILDEYKQSN